MEIFVCDYLNANYYIDKSDIGNYGIYSKNDTRRYKAPISGDKLLKEVSLIFGLDDETSKTIINNWANVDLEFFWKNNAEIFTNISNVLLSLQHFDLVSVKPMAEPTGKLFYIDYVYGEKKKSKFNTFFNNIYIKTKNFINTLWKKLN